MKQRIMLMCALLISVITLSGAANRSFHTTLEQWNPIGFTQSQAGAQTTNRLTAGSAILPTVATAAPSGVLRGGSTNVITFTTAKANGEEITLYMEYSGDTPTLSGATGTPESGKDVTYRLTSQTVTIRGDVTELYCNENQLTTLDVSKNTALTNLVCSINQLRALDVSKNTALTKLQCDNNQLTALDLSKNTALTGLICFYNQLTALDLPQNTALTALYCDNNQLTTLDVSKNTALTGLYCSDNQLTALDVSKNTALEILWCSNNQLKALDVSQNTALEKLYCNGNQLTTLDVSKNTALTELDCSLNQLTALDVSKNTALTALYCSNNQLTTLDVSKNTELETLNCSNNYSNNQLKALSQKTALTGLDCSLNQLTALDVSQNTALTDLDCSGNQIKGAEMTRLVNSLPDRTGKDDGTFIVVREPALEGNICLKSDVAIAKGKNWNTRKYNSDTKEYVAYEGADASPKISFTTAKADGETVRLYMEYSGDTPTLSGATGTPKSGWSTYTLTSQTVTITGDVTLLNCGDNQLTTLDVSKNTALIGLYCSDNQLTALDVSKNTALTELYCSNNQLKELDVSKNTALKTLWCYNNQLTTLDVSQNTALTGLYCCGNQIKGEEMTRLVNSLPGRTGMDAGEIVVVQSDAESNRCLKSDVAIAKSKNWKTLKYKSDTEGYVDYEGEEPIPYAVTLTKEGEGTITATGAADLNAVPEGTELTIEATPAAGYELKALTANGTDILATKKFTVRATTEVKATFAKTYAVTLTKEGEGTLTATGAADLNAVPEGTELTIVATPADGYELKALTANGADILATKKFVVTAATEVKATFAKKTAADVVESSSVRLYPNPASTHVNVKGVKADALVRLYDANGSLRYEARTDADGTLQIDLSAYAEGTYLLRVGGDAQRLLIQR